MVEHSGFEPLTSTMRMSRATNCANAPNCVFFQRSIILAQTAEKSKGKRKFFCAAGVMPAAAASRMRGNGAVAVHRVLLDCAGCGIAYARKRHGNNRGDKKRGHATHSRARTVKKAPIRKAGCNEGRQALRFSSYPPALPGGAIFRSKAQKNHFRSLAMQDESLHPAWSVSKNVVFLTRQARPCNARAC